MPAKLTAHVVGIAGIGMSAIAKFLQHKGYAVQGSDLRSNYLTDTLKSAGIKFFDNHHKNNIRNVDFVVRSSAIKDDNVEIQSAYDNSLQVFSRAEMLARLLEGSYNICVTGTHGKTSTTALVFNVLSSLNPSVLCGGIIDSIASNIKIDNNDLWVVEADESDGTFAALPTDIAVITNIDEEHLEYYGDFSFLIKLFEKWI